MQKVLGLVFCFIGAIVFAQQQIHGSIVEEQSRYVGQVLVINMSNQKNSYSDFSGKFIIEADLGDEIRFVKDGFYRSQIKVSEENLKTELLIFLKRLEIVIPEVKIKYKPTGDIKKDSKYLDDSRKLATLKSSMEDYMKSPMNEAVPENKMPKSLESHDFKAGQVDLFKVIAGAVGLVNKATKPKITKPNFYETQNFIQRIKNEVDLNFLKKYGMNDERINQFLLYAEKVNRMSKRYRKDFKAETISFELQGIFAGYKKINKLSD